MFTDLKSITTYINKLFTLRKNNHQNKTSSRNKQLLIKAVICVTIQNRLQTADKSPTPKVDPPERSKRVYLFTR